MIYSANTDSRAADDERARLSFLTPFNSKGDWSTGVNAGLILARYLRELCPVAVPRPKGIPNHDHLALRTDGNHRYSVTKNKRSPFVS